MGKVNIKVGDFYGNPSYYSVMPQDIFDAFETAYLNGEECALVDKERFDTMVAEHKTKMEQWKG